MSADKPPLFPGKRITGHRNLVYAALHPFPLPGWAPPHLLRVKGENWQAIFKVDGADYIEIERGGTIVERRLDGPNVLIGGVEGFSDPIEATKAQKPVVDAIRGLILLAGPPGGPLLLPPVWEGILKKSSPDTLTFEVGRREAAAPGITAGQLRGWGTRWQTFDPLSSPPEIGFGLRWYYKGMVDLHKLPEDRVDAFVALWICIITLLRAWYAQNVGGDPSEMARFVAYAKRRLHLSGTDLEDAKKQFRKVRNRRNKLLKGGGGMVVSEEEATIAASVAHRILANEISHYSAT